MENSSESLKPVDLPIVFVVAMGLGTTLFQSMLDSHPEIIAPYESRFVIHFKNKYGSITNWNQKVKDNFIFEVKKEMKIAFFWDIDEELLAKRIHNLPEKTDYGSVCKQVYASFKSAHPKEPAKVIIDKNPIHHLLLESLLEVFPNAIFIHLIRDYRASSSSMHQLKKKKKMREFGFRWLLANQEIDKIKKNRPEKFITLRYEDLLQKPEDTLHTIMKFLHLEFHNNMITYHERFGGLMEKYLERSPSEEIKKIRLLITKTVHKNLTTPIDPKFINKWKTKLTEEQIAVLDDICGKYGSQYGYKALTEVKTIPDIPLDILFVKKKIEMYYRLPIWLREIKSKPSLLFYRMMTVDFYIMAMGRSGTTLLQNILNAHPNVVVPPESFFVLLLYTKYKDETIWAPDTIQKFIDDLYSDRPFRLMWQVNRETVEASFRKQQVHSFAEACSCVKASFQESFNSKKLNAIGDKNPLYSTFTERLLKINPKSKIIHMVRDPRGTANGHINTFNRKDALMVGLIWTKYNECILKVKEHFPDQYLFVKYEDLIADTGATLAKICSFLNVEYNPEILTYRKATVAQFETYTTALKWKHENLLKPIDSKIAEKWKTALTPREIKHIEYTTYKTAKKLGYNFERPALDLPMTLRLPFSRLKAELLYFVVHLYFNLPFILRKFILSIRSFLGDKKYQKN